MRTGKKSEDHLLNWAALRSALWKLGSQIENDSDIAATKLVLALVDQPSECLIQIECTFEAKPARIMRSKCEGRTLRGHAVILHEVL